MQVSWEMMPGFVGGFLIVWFACLLVAWLYSRKKDWNKRSLPAYENFKENLLSQPADAKIILIPGSVSILSPDQVVVVEHCQRMLLKNREFFNGHDCEIFVSCPFKYEILHEFVRTNDIKVGIDFLSPDWTGFCMASMGNISRKKPALTFFNSLSAIESLFWGDTANCTGSTFITSAEPAGLPEAAIVSTSMTICEEMYALPAYEEEKPVERIFLLASDLVRATIILVIIVFSLSETYVSLFK